MRGERAQQRARFLARVQHLAREREGGRGVAAGDDVGQAGKQVASSVPRTASTSATLRFLGE
jgi:hypothetical protein